MHAWMQYNHLKCTQTCIHYMFTSNKQEVLQKLSKMLQDGLVFGKLGPHHAEMVASQWPRLHHWPNKVAYFKELIESYCSSAIYSTENLDVPIAYCVQLPYGGQMFSYTDEKYRGKQLSWTISLHLYFMMEEFITDNHYPVLAETARPVRSSNEFIVTATRHGSVKDLIIKPPISLDSKL